MIRTLLFDLDGTLLDTNAVKGWAFRELFADKSEEFQKKIDAYHAANREVSRFEKIRAVCGMGDPEVSPDDYDILVRKYAELVRDRCVSADLIPGAQAFLDDVRGRFPLYVISAAPEGEIRSILSERGMAERFDGIYGSPTPKVEHMKRVIAERGHRPSEAVYFGDADLDEKASREAGLRFFRITTFVGVGSKFMEAL